MIEHRANTPSESMFTIINLSRLCKSVWQQNDRDTTSASNKYVRSSVVEVDIFYIKRRCVGTRHCLLITQHTNNATTQTFYTNTPSSSYTDESFKLATKYTVEK